MQSDLKSGKADLVKDFVKRFWPFTLIFISVSTFEKYISVYIAQVTGRFADGVLHRNAPILVNEAYRMLLALFIVMFVLPVLNYLSNKVLLVVGSRYDLHVFGKFLRQKFVSLKRFDAGDLLNRLYNDPTTFRLAVNQLIEDGVVDLFTFSWILWIMSRLNSAFTVVCVISSLLPVVFPLITKGKVEEMNARELQVKGEIKDAEKRMVENYSFIQAHSLEDRTVASLVSLHTNFFKTVFRQKSQMNSVVNGVNNLVTQGGTIVLYLTGSYLISVKALSPGAVITFAALTSQMQGIFRNAAALVGIAAGLKVSLDRLPEILCHDETEGTDSAGRPAEIQAEELSFNHNGNSGWSLPPQSFRLSEGGKLVVAGPNGSGKTTLIRLLTGLYEGYKGKLSINGKPVSRLNKDYLRDQLTVVPQFPFLFSGTVRMNVSLGKPDASPAEVDSILERMGLAAIADDEVGEGGKFLSGGQRQRVGLARAILRDTPVLIFDEPTNSLDSLAVERVREMLADPAKTILVVTHDEKLMPEKGIQMIKLTDGDKMAV